MAHGRTSALRIMLSSEERQTSERWQRSTTIAAGLVRRGKIVFLLAAGHLHAAVAQTVGVQRMVVRKWARRFLAQRLDGLADVPSCGAKGVFPQRSQSTWHAWPVNVLIRWAVASPSRRVPNWHAKCHDIPYVGRRL